MREWITETTLHLYSILLPISQWAFIISIVLLLPMAIFQRTRSLAGSLLFALSYLFGITTWLLGAGISFASFGWWGLILGLIIFGIGVVPIGIIGAYFELGITGIAVSLIFMSVITYGTRLLGAYFVDKSPS